MIDPEKVGLIGHSWGYQTTFCVTQDDLFASAVAGAPLTILLKGEPAPDWITKGLSYIEQQDGLKKKKRPIS